MGNACYCAPCLTSTRLVRLTIRFVPATYFVACLVTFVTRPVTFVTRLVTLFTHLAALAAHLVTLVTHFVAHLVLIRLAVVYFVPTVFSSAAVATAVYPLFMTVALSVVTCSRTTVALVALKHIPWCLVLGCCSEGNM